MIWFHNQQGAPYKQCLHFNYSSKKPSGCFHNQETNGLQALIRICQNIYKIEMILQLDFESISDFNVPSQNCTVANLLNQQASRLLKDTKTTSSDDFTYRIESDDKLLQNYIATLLKNPKHTSRKLQNELFDLCRNVISHNTIDAC